MIIYYMDTELGVFVQSELSKRDWSQSELARRAGVSHATISHLMAGTFKPSENTLIGIAKALNVPPEKLFQVAGMLPKRGDRNHKETELLYYFALLPDEEQEMTLRQLKATVDYLEREGKLRGA